LATLTSLGEAVRHTRLSASVAGDPFGLRSPTHWLGVLLEGPLAALAAGPSERLRGVTR